MHIHTHTHSHTYIHTHIHTYTHIHTCITTALLRQRTTRRRVVPSEDVHRLPHVEGECAARSPNRRHLKHKHNNITKRMKSDGVTTEERRRRVHNRKRAHNEEVHRRTRTRGTRKGSEPTQWNGVLLTRGRRSSDHLGFRLKSSHLMFRNWAQKRQMGTCCRDNGVMQSHKCRDHSGQRTVGKRSSQSQLASTDE
jgi:hypothetical protein